MPTKKQYREMLDGQEILSLKFEGAVGIHGNKLIREGRVIKTLKTKKDWEEISREAFYDEFGYYPESPQFKKALEEEFRAGTIWDKARKRKKLKKVL